MHKISSPRFKIICCEQFPVYIKIDIREKTDNKLHPVKVAVANTCIWIIHCQRFQKLTRLPLGVNSGYFGFSRIVKYVFDSNKRSIELYRDMNISYSSAVSSVLNNFQYKNTIFSGAVYRNVVKFTYIRYKLMFFRKV